MTTLYHQCNNSTGHVHTPVVQVYALAGHAHAGTCTCNNSISAIDLVHGFVNMHAAQPSVWHFSALVFVKQACFIVLLVLSLFAYTRIT